MRTEYTFTFTVTLRPLKWLRNLAAAAIVMAVVMLPVTKLSSLAAEVPPDVKQMSFENARRVVDQVIADRRPSMDVHERWALSRTIVEESMKANFDPLFVLSIIDAESRFDYRARSIRCRETGVESTCYLNASGLMQVIPRTWSAEIVRRKLGKMDAMNPYDNVVVGVGYLEHLGRGFRRTSSILWAYNQGAGVAMGKYPADWSVERVGKARSEGAYFERKVTKTYLEFLAKYCGIKKVNYKRLQQLYRAPTLTVYAPAIQGDVYGPPELPRATRVAANKAVAPYGGR